MCADPTFDPSLYLTGPTVPIHSLLSYESALFLVSPRCRSYIWRGGTYEGGALIVRGSRIRTGPCRPGALDDTHRGVVHQAVSEMQAQVGRGYTCHLVIHRPRQVLACADGLLEAYTTLGVFGVPAHVKAQLYSRAAEGPLPTLVREQGPPDALTPQDVEEVLGMRPAAPSGLQGVKRGMAAELAAYTVDLLRAGTGTYTSDGTLRTLVQDRLDIAVDNCRDSREYQEIYLTKALVRLCDLGRYLLTDHRSEYFAMRMVEKIDRMKYARGCPRTSLAA